MVKGYYIDSCIWLNLFKREGDPAKGKPYWKIAEEFVEDQHEIFFSQFILREIENKISRGLFEESVKAVNDRGKLLYANNRIFTLARKLESESRYRIAFCDCIHIAMCKYYNLILITRDRELIDFAKNYIQVSRPEELIV